MSWFPPKRTPSDPPATAGADRPLLNNRYRLGRQLGKGGASQVFDADDLRTGGPVAVKLIQLPADLPATQRREWTTRLHREAELARKLGHPGIVTVYEAGLQGQLAWLVMERIRGVDLSRYTQRHLLLPENLVLSIGARVAAALAHAHAQGVVHRDLKPANVLVNLATGLVKLADFGVARADDTDLTRTGLTLGTPAYMAPEQLAGAPASAATDTYSLGVMLFELLAGRRPHQAATLGDLLQATANQPPASLARLRPDLPAPLVVAVEQLMAREPAHRPAQLDIWAASVAGLAAVMTRLLAPSASSGQ